MTCVFACAAGIRNQNPFTYPLTFTLEEPAVGEKIQYGSSPVSKTVELEEKARMAHAELAEEQKRNLELQKENRKHKQALKKVPRSLDAMILCA